MAFTFDVVERATYNVGFIIKQKIIDKANATKDGRLAACEEARTLIGEQGRVRAVLQPGVTVNKHIIAADRFVVTSTARWPDWEKVFRPDDSDLAGHPWYNLYSNRSGEHLYHPNRPRSIKDDSRLLTGETAVEVDGEPTAVSTTSLPNSPCLTCVARGIACIPRRNRACWQCRDRKIKCSHSPPIPRARFVSRHTPALKRAVRDPEPTLNLAEKYTLALTPSVCCPRDAFISRAEHDKLFEGLSQYREVLKNAIDVLERLEERLGVLQDRWMAWMRAVEYTTR